MGVKWAVSNFSAAYIRTKVFLVARIFLQANNLNCASSPSFSAGGNAQTFSISALHFVDAANPHVNKKAPVKELTGAVNVFFVWNYFLRRRNGTPASPRPNSSIEAGSGVVVGGPMPTSFEIAKAPSPWFV
jgi:hypothetical protein